MATGRSDVTSDAALADSDAYGDRGLPQLEALAVLRRRWSTILTVAGVLALAAFGLSHLQPAHYLATGRLILSDPRASLALSDPRASLACADVDVGRHLRTQATVATSAPVLERTAQLIGGRRDAAELRELVGAQASRDVNLLVLTAVDSTPDGAKEIADALAQAYQDAARAQVEADAAESLADLEVLRNDLVARLSALDTDMAGIGGRALLEAEREFLATQLISLRDKETQIIIDRAAFGSGVQVAEEADLPRSPEQPRPLRNAALGGLVGLVAAWGLAWWRGQRHRVASDRHDAAPVLGAPLLGVMPGFRGIAPGHLVIAPAEAGEAARFAALSLDGVLRGEGAGVVCFAGPRPDDGRTLTALHVAGAAAEEGRRVVLVDGDLGRRSLTSRLRLEGAKGLTDLCSGASPEDCVQRIPWGQGHLAVCPVGSTLDSGAGPLHSLGLQQAVAALRQRGELVVLDSPGVLDSADALVLARIADGVVFVVQAGSPLDALEDAAGRVSVVGAPIFGYVFSGTRGGAWWPGLRRALRLPRRGPARAEASG